MACSPIEPERYHCQGPAVSLYFFNVHIGDDILSDSEGQQLRDADQAWEVANAMARNLMNTEFERSVNWASSHIEVKDDAGGIVLEFPFLEALQFTQQPH